MTLTTDIIKVFEGLRLKAYRDGGGKWTIGWGHTQGVVYGMVITEERAEEFLREDMAWAIDTVRRTVKVALTNEQRAASISITFNIGSGGWKSSTILRRLNAGDYEGAADAFLLWNKITVDGVKKYDQGLANRREKERAVFLSGTGTPETSSGGGGIVTGGEAKPLRHSKTQWLGLGGVLTTVLTAWGQLHRDAPDIVAQIAPYAPYLLGVIFLAVMFNRYMDSRKGIH